MLPGGFRTRITTPLDEVLARESFTSAIKQLFYNVFIRRKRSLVGESVVGTKIRDMNFIFNSAIFQVAKTIASRRNNFINAIRTGVEVLQLVSVAWDASTNSITGLKGDSKLGFLGGD
jgi:hypothetical protein